MTDGKTKIIFIVNPKAGITPKSKVIIELLAGNIFPASRFIQEVVFTERVGHATELARDAVAREFESIFIYRKTDRSHVVL